MDILDKIIKERGNLNDLYYVLSANGLRVNEVEANSHNITLSYPPEITKPFQPISSTLKAVTKLVTVDAYQSVFDVCVQYYGNINNIQKLLDDNKLSINDYLQVGSLLSIRVEDINNKVAKTLSAQQKIISNYDRVIPSDQDIYLGTEDDYFIGANTSVKIKVN